MDDLPALLGPTSTVIGRSFSSRLWNALKFPSPIAVIKRGSLGQKSRDDSRLEAEAPCERVSAILTISRRRECAEIDASVRPTSSVEEL